MWFGEHGESAVCCLSTTRIDGTLIDPDDPRTVSAVTAFRAWSRVITTGTRRGRAGVAGAVLAAIQATLGLRDTTEVQAIRYPEHRSWLGQPMAFTGGYYNLRMPRLDAAEKAHLRDVDRKLRAAYIAVRQHMSIPDNHTSISDSEETVQ